MPFLVSQSKSVPSIGMSQAEQLSGLVEALKLRFQILPAGSRRLKDLLGGAVAGRYASQDEDVDDEEDESPTKEVSPNDAENENRRTQDMAKLVEVQVTDAHHVEHCGITQFQEQLQIELKKAQSEKSPAADLFYKTLGGEKLAEVHRQISFDLIAALDAAAAQAQLPQSDSEKSVRKTGSKGQLDTAANLRDIMRRLITDSEEKDIVFFSWLKHLARLQGLLPEARVRLAAQKALAAAEQGKITGSHVTAVFKAVEETHKAHSGGVGPITAAYKPCFRTAQNMSASDGPAEPDPREEQTVAHLLHSMFHTSGSRASRIARNSTEETKYWMRRVTGVLVHVHFHLSHLEMAEAATGDRTERDIETLHETIRDFKPLKYDKDSAFLLYVSGRARHLDLGIRRRPVVLVITCSFGGGHRAAAQAVSGYFVGRAEVVIVDTSLDTDFLEKDLIHRIGKMVGAQGWNQTTIFNDLILKRQLYGWINFSEGFGKFEGQILHEGRKGGIAPYTHSPESDTTFKRILRGQILSIHPELVVSVYHMDLNPIMALCEELGSLPLLHLATDLDVKMWEVFGRSPPVYPKFSVSVPFNVPLSWDSAKPLTPTQVFLGGYPVREEFLLPRPTAAEIEAMRRSRGMEHNEQLVLVMTGGGGQDVPWPEMLANSSTWGTGDADCPLRVVIVAGKNVDIVERLKKKLKPDSQGLLRGSNKLVSVQAARDSTEADPKRPYFLSSNELVTLMDVASLVITKPGGGSTAEIAYRGLPAVLDASKGAMHWEAFTIERFEEEGRGVALRSSSSDALEGSLRNAQKIMRDQKLAQGEDGKLLNTAERVRHQAKLLTGMGFEKVVYSV